MIITSKRLFSPWVLKLSDFSLEEFGHPWRLVSSLYVIFYLCIKFQLSIMIKSVLRISHPWTNTWRILHVLDWRFRGWGHRWCHESSLYVILYCVPNFSSLAWLKVHQAHLILKVLLGGCWRFLTRFLEDEASLTLGIVIICDYLLVCQISFL